MMTLRLAVRLLLVFAPITLAAQQARTEAQPADTSAITIGLLASLTGKESIFGVELERGVHLALDELNAAGGIEGRRIVLVTRDTRSVYDGAVDAARELCADGSIAVIIGDVASSRALAISDITERKGVPVVNPAATNPRVTIGSDGRALPNTYRTCFVDPLQGTAMAMFAYRALHLKRVGVLVDSTNAYTTSLAATFIATFKRLGGMIVHEDRYDLGVDDYREPLLGMKHHTPEALYIPGYYMDVRAIAVQARKLGIMVPLLGGDGWDAPDLVAGAEARQAFERCYFTNHFSPDAPTQEVERFVARYKAAHHGTVPGLMAALGYDAMMIIGMVMQRAGSATHEAIRAGLASLRKYPGLIGPITINEMHDAVKPMVIMRVTSGRFRYHATIEPDALPH